MQSKELYYSLVEAVTLPVSDGEKQTLIRWLLEERLGLKTADLMTGKDVPVSSRHFEQDIKRLNSGEPLQYLLGQADFFGRKFRVNPSVLVPRPETELMVQYIIETLGRGISGTLLDVGTGSGCIAVTLALELPGATVVATDVDPQALAVARENARNLQATVKFHQNNILTEELPGDSVDAVVSNPPYVRESEKKSLAHNVMGFEPHHALFVPDDDPLIFHRTITQKARLALKPGGLLTIEINEALGPEVREEVGRVGFSGITLHQDLDGKDRFVTAINPL